MLESGCVSIKNEVNIMMKNVVDIVLGGTYLSGRIRRINITVMTFVEGLTYWIFGYAMSFGRSEYSSGFMAVGDFCLDPTLDDPLKGAIYAAFIFELSFATTATTIVSGAMAERYYLKRNSMLLKLFFLFPQLQFQGLLFIQFPEHRNLLYTCRVGLGRPWFSESHGRSRYSWIWPCAHHR